MVTKQIVSLIIDTVILICTAFIIYLLYVHDVHVDLNINRTITTAVILAIAGSLVLYEIICRNKSSKIKKFKKLKKIRVHEVSTLILLGENDRPIKIWDLTGKVGLVVGKSSEDYQVEIDLSDTDYHSYIDNEHALINCIDSGWWLQNISTGNEVAIHRKGKELLLGHQASDRLHKGDVIKIAHYTRIAVN